MILTRSANVTLGCQPSTSRALDRCGPRDEGELLALLEMGAHHISDTLYSIHRRLALRGRSM